MMWEIRWGNEGNVGNRWDLGGVWWCNGYTRTADL